MSENNIPLWKQELLRRRERKLSKEESAVDKRTKKSDLVVTNVQTGVREQVNVKEVFGNSTTRHQVNVGRSPRLCDGDGQATSLSEEAHLTTANNHNRSRIGQLPSNMPSTKRGEAARLDTDQVANGHGEQATNRLDGPRISRIDGEYSPDDKKAIHSLQLDEKDKQNLRKFLNPGQVIVDDEHIRPKDLKKLWQQNESRDKLLTESDRSPSKKVDIANNVSPKEVKKFWQQNETQGKLSPEGNRSPSKKLEVLNRISQKEFKSISQEHDFTHKDECSPSKKSVIANNGPIKHNVDLVGTSPSSKTTNVAVKSGLPNTKSFDSPKCSPKKQKYMDVVLTNGPTVDDESRPGQSTTQNGQAMECDVPGDIKVEDMHIASVKSLLGLFGGKSSEASRSPNEHRVKEQQSPTSPQRPSNLSRYYSEPSLHVCVTEDDESTSKAYEDDEVAMTTHHVASSIKKRMKLLRRASSSSLVDNVHVDNDDDITSSDQIETITKETGCATVEVTPEVTDSTLPQNNSKIEDSTETKPTSLRNPNKDISKPNTIESKENNSLKTKNDSSQPVVDIRERKTYTIDVKNNESATESEAQSFDKLLSVFGPRVNKKSAQTINHIKTSKAVEEIKRKQNHYVVEVAQTNKGLEDQEMPTHHSKKITQSQQVEPDLIKKEQGDAKVVVKNEQKRGVSIYVNPTTDSTAKRVARAETPVSKAAPEKQTTVEVSTVEADEPRKRSEINHVSNLNNADSQLAYGSVDPKDMLLNHAPSKNKGEKAIPVTSIDEIPISSIDSGPIDVKNGPVGTTSVPEGVVNNNVSHGGTATTTENTEVVEKFENEQATEEEIPISSIDVINPNDDTIPSAPEIIHDIFPDNVKPILSAKKNEKRGNVSFFQHVYIHDYQSESAAMSDWDFENGEALGSYTPHAVLQYQELSQENPAPIPALTIDEPEAVKPDKPVITYNEHNLMGFTESNDSMAGAMLF